MEGHGRDLSPMERSRLLTSGGLDTGPSANGGNGGSGGGPGGGAGGGTGLVLTSVSEYASRTATPTPLTSLAAQYSSRYGLPPALPAHSYSLMSSLLSSAHSADARKALLPEFQPYPWGEGVQRYLMSGLYPPYPALFPPTAESLSLLGAAAGVGGAAPAPAHHTSHYQRLVEMQKEAYIASMSAAAASHHPALYALPPQFVEPTPLPPPPHVPVASSATPTPTSSSCSSSTSPAAHVPLSLVKQEPRDLSCAEKVARQSERRTMGVKVDLDQHHHHARLVAAAAARSSSPPPVTVNTGGGGRTGGDAASSSNLASWSTPLKEPKLSPSSVEVPPATAVLMASVAGAGGGSGGRREGSSRSNRHGRTSPRGEGSRASTPRDKHSVSSNGGGGGSGNSVVGCGGNGNGSSDNSSNFNSNEQELVARTGATHSSSLPSPAPAHRDRSRSSPARTSSVRRSATPAPAHTNASQRVGVVGSSQPESNATSSPSSKKAGRHSNQGAAASSRQASRTSPPTASGTGGIMTDLSVPSVPTKLAPPIALASMQHDGLILSALASPSSAAAACSAAAKSLVVKQQVAACEDQNGASRPSSSNAADVISYRSGISPGGTSPQTSSVAGQGGNTNDQVVIVAGSRGRNNSRQQQARDRNGDAAKTSSDDGASDIVVDSTESDDVMSTCDEPPAPSRTTITAPQAPYAASTSHPPTSNVRVKSEQELAIEETIQRVVNGSDSADDDDDDVPETTSTSNSASSSLPMLPAQDRLVARTVTMGRSGARETSSSVAGTTTSATTSGTRTVYAKTQNVPPMTVSGTIPVGIAVAKIRPHHVHQPRDHVSASGGTRDYGMRHASPTGTSNRTLGQSSSRSRSGTSSQTNLIHGRSAPPSSWGHQQGATQSQSGIAAQIPSRLTSTLSSSPSSSSSASSSPRYPVSAPPGFKFSVDPSSGQIFLVHSEEQAEGTWSVPGLAPPTDANSVHPRTIPLLPTVTVHNPERDSEEQGANGRLDSGKRDPLQVETASYQVGTVKPQNHNGSSIGDHSSNNNTTAANGSSPRVTSSGNSNSGVGELLNPHNSNGWKSSESRGCSPILCDDLSSPLSLLSALSSLSSRKPTTCSVGTQAGHGGEGLGRGRKKRGGGSPFRNPSVDRAVQTCSPPTPAPHALPPLLLAPTSSSSVPTSSSFQHLLQASTSSSPSSKLLALKPLSVHCPSSAGVRSGPPSLNMQRPLEVKVGLEEDATRPASQQPRLYNPYTDPQILQAAHGLELLSTLAEKRPKCSSSSAPSSLDDPKLIYPSPSDSFDTLSPTADILPVELSASGKVGGSSAGVGQCFTPRRASVSSPKWMHPKKEPQDGLSVVDFKPPPELELQDDLEVRVKMKDLQRQYKKKQRELAKLQSKKIEPGSKSWKRGPGRPPKKKSLSKKSDDDSSSSSSKPRETQHPPQQKKKRQAEELVDRIYRKLAPDKPSKASRSIHYVKSKTGPFFRRKSASKSVKRNKDLFGGDPSTWPSYSERKHQENVRYSEIALGKEKHKTSPSYTSGMSNTNNKGQFSYKTSKGLKSPHKGDSGNIFSNLQKSATMEDKQGSEYGQSPVKPAKSRLVKSEYSSGSSSSNNNSTATNSDLHLSSSSLTAAISESLPIKLESLSGPTTLLAKLALTTASKVSTLSSSDPATATSASSTRTLNSSAASSSGASVAMATPATASSMGCFIPASTSFSSHPPALGAAAMTSFSRSSTATTTATFGSISTLTLGVGLFSTNNGCVSNGNGAKSLAHGSSDDVATSTSVTTVITTTTSVAASPGRMGTITTTTTSSGATTSVSSSGNLNSNTSGSGGGNCEQTASSSQEEASISVNNTTSNETSGGTKRKADDDSDTDASDTSPNKKRKPGRPRKINPDKTSGGTETIWAKKSCHAPASENNNQTDSRKSESDFSTPLFLDDEWTRRRSERIFLSEVTPVSALGSGSSAPSSGATAAAAITIGASQAPGLSLTIPSASSVPPSAVSPRPSELHIWKLSNFMPKSKKLQEIGKSQSADAGSRVEVKTEKRDGSTDCKSGTPGGKRSKTESVGASKKNSVAGAPAVLNSSSTEEQSSSGQPSSTCFPFTSSSLTSSSPPKKGKRGRKPKEDGLKKAKKTKSKTGEVVLSSSPSPSPPKLGKKGREVGEERRGRKQKVGSLHNITQRVKKKFSKAKKQGDDTSGKNKTSKDKSKGKDYDPLDVEGPPTPEPRCCKLQTTDLREGLRVLYLNDGLFYEGSVKALQPPDVYGVLTAGQRGSRPHILCQEEVLKDAVLDVRPGSKRYLPVGTRVCAFWSQQFSCLYPGTVAKSSSSSSAPNTVQVDFDDEDTGRIPIEHIRLLPSDFPIIEYEPDPLENLPKRRRPRAQSDASESEKPNRSRAKVKKTDKESEDEDEEEEKESDDDDEKEDSSDGTDTSTELLYWRWHGDPVRKPGQKGKLIAKGKRVFYKSITRDSVVINVGDAAQFVSTGRPEFPYIGNIENLWQTSGGAMMVKVRWYYHPQETNSGKKLGDLKNALFTSPHMDENDVQTISTKVEVMTPAQFRKRGQPGGRNVYYCAGHYDPVSNALTMSPGVL